MTAYDQAVPRPLNHSFLLVAALSWLLHGCAATTLSDQSNDRSSQLLRQYDDRFGKLRWGQCAGEWPASDGLMPFTVDWCRASYSDYDLMQSKEYFRDRAAYVATLSFSSGNRAPIFLSSGGLAQGNDIVLWEVPLPPPSSIGDGKVEVISDYLKRLNARLQGMANPWQVLRMKLPPAGMEGTSRNVEIRVLATSGLPAPSSLVVPLRLIDHPSCTSCAWIGTSHYDDKDAGPQDTFERLNLLTSDAGISVHGIEGPQTGRWGYFGFISSSHRDRRLEGDVPVGSLWRSREQFVRFIQETEGMGIGSFDDPLPKEVQTLLQREIGQAISGEQLKKDAQQIFGSWEAMIDATCQAPELWHLPVFAAAHDQGMLILNVQWYFSAESTPLPWLYSFRMHAIPNRDAGVFHTDLVWGRFQKESQEVKLMTAPSLYSWFRLFPQPRVK